MASDRLLTRSERSTIRKFAHYSTFIDVERSGRAVISYRKSIGSDYGQFAVELWLGLRPPQVTAYNIERLINGELVVEQVDGLQHPPWSNLTGRLFIGRPIAAFTLDSISLEALRRNNGSHAQNVVRLDRVQEAETVINDTERHTEVKITEFNGAACKFLLPTEVLRRLPKGDYWVKVFPNGVASFEIAGGGFVFRSVVGAVEELIS